MKFGRYLREHVIDEWRRAYVNCTFPEILDRQLKKQIVKAGDETNVLDEAAEADEVSSQMDLERGSTRPAREQDQQPANDDANSSVDPHNATITDAPGTASPVGSGFEASPIAEQSTSSPSAERSNPPTASAASSQNRPVRLPSIDSRAEKGPSPGPAPRRLLDRLPRRTSSFKLTKAGDFNPKNFRPGFSNSMLLLRLLELAPPVSRRFFGLMDDELERVSSFYADREAEAFARFEELSGQWKELQSHRKEYQELRAREAPLFPIINHVPPMMPGSKLIRRGLAVGGARHSSHAQDGTVDGEAPVPGGSPRTRFVHNRPEQYRDARSKLKLATFEYYRSLGMLKSYRVLNRTGFAKAQKKFEKATRIPCKPWSYKLEQANFVASTKLDDLIRETEDAFASIFERGDRKKALERLRNTGQSERHHFTAWRAGVYIGIAIPLLIEGCSASTRVQIPYWEALMQLFGAMFLPIFFSVLFFLNLSVWAKTRINYILIFELDIRTRLDVHQFIEVGHSAEVFIHRSMPILSPIPSQLSCSQIPALLLGLLCLFFWAAFTNFAPDRLPPSAYPLAFFILVLVLLLIPLPILYPSARWWMIRTFCRVLTAGLIAVQFSDFFLGDELNSLYYSDISFRAIFCISSLINRVRSQATPVLASLPAIWRLGQSLRRYIDSDGLVIHMLNGGKYTASILQFCFYYSWRIDGSTSIARKAIWIMFAVTNSCYTATWDIVMDWSLLQKNSKNFLLRNELGFRDQKWAYYVATVVNIILRFSWVIYITDSGPSLALKGFIVALLEACRRIVWNTFRVESEHCGNVDGYRVTRNVPLPYTPAIMRPRDDQDDHDDLASPRTRKQVVFDFLHSLHRSIVDDFSPLANISLLRMSARSKSGSNNNGKTASRSRKAKGSAGTTAESSSEDGGGAHSNDEDEDDDEDGRGGYSGSEDGADGYDLGTDRMVEQEIQQADLMMDLPQGERRL
ncbi:BZ3500_MvSof-1268-A1-R1_Chr3-1g05915 [Microbotryum saponariae]|uniref:BZ3500_MvSof-1268-A1-R1_Chr3-1g05915 protein n=1 Tax=Microbotryum saponariae TaxID=289078 RepID=A0A2X0L4A1_9BASI|nr:BZ3500_MvSof-1268-A1-R1_Chr3-1g05915 [Microbotryum saponariae]SDA05105.1 BZ3501_MvSof-1269-A2-R1_Chr3-1g05585 [Microbotryum saponariae]